MCRAQSDRPCFGFRGIRIASSWLLVTRSGERSVFEHLPARYFSYARIVRIIHVSFQVSWNETGATYKRDQFDRRNSGYKIFELNCTFQQLMVQMIVTLGSTLCNKIPRCVRSKIYGDPRDIWILGIKENGETMCG